MARRKRKSKVKQSQKVIRKARYHKPRRGVERKTARLKPYYEFNRNEALRMRQVYQNISTIQQDSQIRRQIEADETYKKWIGREKELMNTAKKSGSLDDKPLTRADLDNFVQGRPTSKATAQTQTSDVGVSAQTQTSEKPKTRDGGGHSKRDDDTYSINFYQMKRKTQRIKQELAAGLIQSKFKERQARIKKKDEEAKSRRRTFIGGFDEGTPPPFLSQQGPKPSSPPRPTRSRTPPTPTRSNSTSIGSPGATDFLGRLTSSAIQSTPSPPRWGKTRSGSSPRRLPRSTTSSRTPPRANSRLGAETPTRSRPPPPSPASEGPIPPRSRQQPERFTP
eukprot:SAG11_NODE_3884_length_2169_cov_149.440097_3_plen_336_part_00